jgi:hypothetical protein
MRPQTDSLTAAKRAQAIFLINRDAGATSGVQSRGRSLPGASLAAETEFVIGTTPSRSRLGIGGLRFRAARVSKRFQFQPKTTRFLESLECLRHVKAQLRGALAR